MMRKLGDKIWKQLDRKFCPSFLTRHRKAAVGDPPVTHANHIAAGMPSL